MGSPQKNRTVILIPALVAAMTLVATLLLVSYQRSSQSERLLTNAHTVEISFAARLETHLKARLNAGRLLAMQLSRHDEVDLDTFRFEAELLHQLFGDFQALNWVDTSGVIRVITPEDGNAAALGLDLRTLSEPAEALARAEATGEMQVTPPITLAQGGRGFVIYSPIVVNGLQRGFLNMVFRAEPLIKGALASPTSQGYYFRVTDGDKLLFETGPMNAFDTLAEESMVSVGDREWRLTVAPKPELIQAASSSSDEIILALGVVCAIFVASLSYIAILRQEIVRKSQNRMEDFAFASSDCFWEMNADLEITWASPGVEDLFGVPVEQFIGLKRGHFGDIVENIDNWEAHSEDLAQHRPFRDFLYAARIHGQRKWIRASGVPLFDEGGQFLGYRGTANDATELVRTRNEAARSRERLETAVEELSEVFSLWDEQDRLIFGNKAFRDLNSNIPHVLAPGTSFETYLREGVESGHLRPPEAGFDNFLAMSLERRYDPNAEPFEIERADGIVLRLREQKLDGLGIVTIAQDVTEQRRNEEALRASEERLALAVQNLSIWDWNVQSDELYMSPGFAELLGYSADEFQDIRSAGITSIVHPEDLPEYEEKLRAHIDGKSLIFESEHRFRTRSGDYRWFLANGHAVPLDQGRIGRSTGVLTDITERVELEEKLHQAQKMEAIGSLTGGVAHDFNNLLAVILGNLELIRETGKASEIGDFVDAGIKATRRGADLVNSMLSFARKSRLKPALIDLDQLVQESASWFTHVLPENIELKTQLDGALRTVEADPSLAQNAILNLILNARDAMPEGGTLTIATRNVTVDGRAGDLVEEPGQYVMLCVKDTGSGISQDILDTVFQPFFTTKPPGSGSGLGLSMVQGFMEQSGGRVLVDSKIGHGTQFTLLFRAISPKLSAPVAPPREDLRQASRSARILLVEDEVAVLDVLKKSLTRAGYSVHSARSGDEALAEWSGRRDFDLLITDIVMPGRVQGTELARELRAKIPGLPIIFLSGYSEDAAAQGNRLRSGEIRLMKPISRSALIDAVEQALDSQPVEPAQ